MNAEKIIDEHGLSGHPIGLQKVDSVDTGFKPCVPELVVFDEQSKNDEIIQFENEFVTIHHASLSETKPKKLLYYDDLKIIRDDSWDLRMLLSKIKEKRSLLFSNFAKNCLIESIFCCQKTQDALQASDVFASCWQKCASFYLSDAILSMNNQTPCPPNMLKSLRKLPKKPIYEHLSVINETLGIERATPSLLERMLKSTVGFSDLVEKNNHSEIIKQESDYFMSETMLADCYFYLGYVNKENFVKIKDSLHQNPDLIHILKIAFDVETDELLMHQSNVIQHSCNVILETISNV